jgi:glycosyltransferase involved in cell wall biosynthesis
MIEPRVHRILMTGDTVGGVWTFTIELAEALGARGVEVVLAAMGGPPSADQRAQAARIPTLDLLASDFRLEWMNDPWDDVEESGRWLLDLEEEYAPDVVHLNTLCHGALPWRSAVVLTAHSCVLSWWEAVHGEPAPPRWNRYRAEVEQSLKAVDLLTTPSRSMMDAVEAQYGPDLPRTRVAPNGCRGSRFCAAGKEPFVLAAGRLWDEAKNIRAVAEAAGRLPWPVYIAGEHRHPDGRIADFPGCRILGLLAPGDLAGWYGRASIYALPARYEPFGLSALEAALSGCALVLGDIPSLREVWHDAAVFVSPGDPAAVESGIRSLIDDPDFRAEVARRCADRACRFTPERMAQEYFDAYRFVAGRAGNRRPVLAGSRWSS